MLNEEDNKLAYGWIVVKPISVCVCVCVTEAHGKCELLKENLVEKIHNFVTIMTWIYITTWRFIVTDKAWFLEKMHACT